MSKASRAQARWERKHPKANTSGHRGWGDPRVIRRFWLKEARSADPVTAHLYRKDARNG